MLACHLTFSSGLYLTLAHLTSFTVYRHLIHLISPRLLLALQKKALAAQGSKAGPVHPWSIGSFKDGKTSDAQGTHGSMHHTQV